MTVLPAQKRVMRERAYAARAMAHAEAGDAAHRAAERAIEVLLAERTSGTVSAYLSVRSEIDTMPLMLALAGLGFEVAVPVIVGPARPLVFRAWTPDAVLVPGTFGVPVPADGAEVEPDVLFVPMLAFDAQCHRLGYGGGYYDRTIGGLRSRRPVLAFGFAYAAQAMPVLPVEPTDMRLDAVVTEAGVIRPR